MIALTPDADLRSLLLKCINYASHAKKLISPNNIDLLRRAKIFEIFLTRSQTWQVGSHFLGTAASIFLNSIFYLQKRANRIRWPDTGADDSFRAILGLRASRSCTSYEWSKIVNRVTSWVCEKLAQNLAQHILVEISTQILQQKFGPHMQFSKNDLIGEISHNLVALNVNAWSLSSLIMFRTTLSVTEIFEFDILNKFGRSEISTEHIPSSYIATERF
jgi:hypothetical protein